MECICSGKTIVLLQSQIDTIGERGKCTKIGAFPSFGTQSSPYLSYVLVTKGQAVIEK